MEVQQGGKPKVSYAEFLARLPEKRKGTVAWVIETFIRDMASPTMKPIGGSQMCILRVIQRSEFGSKVAAKLKKADVLDFVKWLRSRQGRQGKPIGASTANQYVTYLSGALKYVGSAYDDCEDVTVAAIEAARPMLIKLQLIGKSVPRTRVPTGDELERLFAAMEEADNRQTYPTKVKLLALTMFALESTRRLGEICRLRWDDIDWDHKVDGEPAPMYTIRDLKHPTKKKGNDKDFPLTPLLAEIIRTQERVSECVFPYGPKSASQAYARIKKQLGIEGLRFHDNRREAITRWLAKLKSPHKVKLISGHETTQILERVYDATKRDSVHQDIRAAA